MPELLTVTDDDDLTPIVEQVALTLRDGGLVVLPTDTSYGLAADAFAAAGTSALFRVRRQPRTTPLPVFVRSPKQLIGLARTVPATAERLMAAFWPGALTLVLVAEPAMRWDLGETDGTLAVRMPLDDVTLAVVRAVGPLAVTGAHRVGQPARASVEEIAADLGDEVTTYLDVGPREPETVSTIVDLTRREPHLLREGTLPGELVLAVARGELEPLAAADAVDRGITRLEDLDEAAGPTDPPAADARPRSEPPDEDPTDTWDGTEHAG